MQGVCGVTAGWCTFLCRICTVRDLWGHSLPLFYHLGKNYMLNPTTKFTGPRPDSNAARYSSVSSETTTEYRIMYTCINDQNKFKFCMNILHLQEDMYSPHPLMQDILWKCLNTFAEPLLMRWPLSKLRHRALRSVVEHMKHEDEATNYVCIGPVSKV